MSSLADLIPNPPVPDRLLGWVYRDMPSYCTKQYFQMLLDILGEGNYETLALSRRVVDGEEYLHAQFYISPEGMANLSSYNAEKRQ